MNITSTPTEKVTLTISAKEIFENFMKLITDLVIDNGYAESINIINTISEVAEALTDESVDITKMRRLFKAGNSIFLVDIGLFDRPNVLSEVVIIGNDDKRNVITHEFIAY